MTTTFTVVLSAGGTVNIEADEYRFSAVGKEHLKELYLYRDDKDDPVATFPAGSHQGVYRAEFGDLPG